jgi:hypothetical protein
MVTQEKETGLKKEGKIWGSHEKWVQGAEEGHR